MQASVNLGQEDRDHLVNIIESSLRVRGRQQFFLWLQGAVQSLLPHEILVCGVDTGGGAKFPLHHFSACHHFHDKHFKALCHPEQGLVPRLMNHWAASKRPCLLAPEFTHGACDTELLHLLEQHQMRNLAAHGVSGSGGSLHGYFCFFQVQGEFGPHLAHVLDLLAPYLHATLARVMAAEPDIAAMAAGGCVFSAREVEVLGWAREGKSNAEIGDLLQLSAYTVKNHLQRVFKKLGVSNRSHAVARAISLGVIKSNQH